MESKNKWNTNIRLLSDNNNSGQKKYMELSRKANESKRTIIVRHGGIWPVQDSIGAYRQNGMDDDKSRSKVARKKNT